VADKPTIPRQKVWDGPTRLFHWLLAGLFFFSWWTAVNRLMDWHRASGLTILGLLVFRLWWGFAGSETARFTSFIKGPKAILSYASGLFGRSHQLAFGHNPLGAVSVAAMLLALVAQVGLGLFAMDTDGIESGPLARFVSFEFAQATGELHETSFRILLVLVGLHIAAILFYLAVKHVNLMRPMVTGYRLGTGSGPADGISPVPISRFLVGVALAGAVVGAVIIAGG